MTDEMDLQLRSLLRTPDAPADEAFVSHMRQAVLVEQRLSAARSRAWTRFAWEMFATGAAIAAFWLLARLAPADSDGIVPLFSPAAAGILLLSLWVIVSVRPSGRSLFGS